MKLPSVSSRLDSLLVPLSLVVSLLLVTAAATTLWITYDEVALKAQRNATDALHLAETHVSREVDMWLFALDLAVSLRSPGDDPGNLSLQRMVFLVAERLPSPVALFLVGPEGKVEADPLDAVSPYGDAVLDDFVDRLRQADDHPVFSEPALWFPGQGKAILVGRRIADGEGRFAGAAIVAVPLAQLGQRLRALGGSGEGLDLFLLTAGGVVVSGAARLERAANPAAAREIIQALRQGPASGHDTAPASGRIADGPMIATYGWIDRTNLMLIVRQSTTQIYAKWWDRFYILSGVVGLMCVAAILLAANLRRELERRRQAEIAMAALATTDGLTGLANRRRFDEVMVRERDRACRARKALSLLALDADRFKRINDSYGHGVGDEVLRLLGRSITNQLRRPGDFAARTGGEEFAVILPETDATGAVHVAERIRADFQERTARLFEGRDGCTVSVGIKLLEPGTPETVSQLLSAADAALYAAKQAGRDRVALAPITRPTDAADHAGGGPDPLWPQGLAGCFA